LTIPVLVEGHITNPRDARRALELGATAVVVGSAITRPETIAARFAEATRNIDLASLKSESV
jgi:N-acylglucosamine-6-phosphate 2-epimerase